MFPKLNVKPVDSDCPLKRCILANDTNAMECVLRKWKKKQTQLQADSEGWTALHFAASKDEYADCLKLLLSSKDTVGFDLNAKTLAEKTAFFLACMEGCVKNCRFLLEGRCNPEIPDNVGFTPLHIASWHGHANVVSQLIAHGLNPNCLNSNGNTALHCASMRGELEVVRVLMASKQTKIDISNKLGQLPLHMACAIGSLDIVRILLEADHRQVNCCCRDTRTPLIIVVNSLMIVSKEGRMECVKYLLRQGANPNCPTRDHETTLCYAARLGDKELLSLVLQRINLTYIEQQLMLNIQVVLSDRWETFNSLMSHVMNSRSPECMSLLLESGIPTSILEAPYLGLGFVYKNYRRVYSPLAYLFSYLMSYFVQDEFDKFLTLLLRYRITHLYEFSRMVKLKAADELTVRYVHPFTNIFIGLWSPMERVHYLNMLLEYGVTTDYCLQCDVHYDSRFLDFDINVLKRFYKPVVWAIKNDKAEFVELLLVNSAILEPSHLWNFLQCRRSVVAERENPKNVINYLIDLGVVVDTSNQPLYPFGGTIKCPTSLQQSCRQVIRKHLRDLTLQDNLKNFKEKIDALLLPNLLKNFLQFK